MQVWNVLHAARWKCRTQKIAKKSPSVHHHTNLSGYIFASKAHIGKKNLLSSNISSRCPHNMLNFGLLAVEIDPVVWGTPANFNGFCVLFWKILLLEIVILPIEISVTLQTWCSSKLFKLSRVRVLRNTFWNCGVLWCTACLVYYADRIIWANWLLFVVLFHILFLVLYLCILGL